MTMNLSIAIGCRPVWLGILQFSFGVRAPPGWSGVECCVPPAAVAALAALAPVGAQRPGVAGVSGRPPAAPARWLANCLAVRSLHHREANAERLRPDLRPVDGVSVIQSPAHATPFAAAGAEQGWAAAAEPDAGLPLALRCRPRDEPRPRWSPSGVEGDATGHARTTGGGKKNG